MPEIQKVRWNHDALISAMIANPDMSQGSLAAVFGYSEAWLSIIINSDAFQEKLTERRDEIINPILRASVEDRFRAVANKASEVVLESLMASPSPKLALQAMEITARALGYGARSSGMEFNVNVTPVAVVPAKEISSHEWILSHSPAARPSEVIDVPAKEISTD
jgi:hypothetical protein